MTGIRRLKSPNTKKGHSPKETAPSPTKRGVLFAGAGGALLFLDFDGAVPILVGFLEQALLTRNVLFEIGLDAQQETFVGQRLVIVRLQLDGLVDRLVARGDELSLVGFRRREVPVGLLPVV